MPPHNPVLQAVQALGLLLLNLVLKLAEVFGELLWIKFGFLQKIQQNVQYISTECLVTSCENIKMETLEI
jgi:hypothetical protein